MTCVPYKIAKTILVIHAYPMSTQKSAYYKPASPIGSPIKGDAGFQNPSPLAPSIGDTGF